MKLEAFRRPVSYLLTSLVLLAFAGTALGEGPPPASFAEALTSGTTALSLRHRFENVSQVGFAEDAEASTMRTALSYSSARYRGFRFFLEAENVTAVGSDDDYNNAGADRLNNGIRDRPVVADPELTQINQVYVELGGEKTALRIGRQEINLGNQRFVGSVAWRQHHQSFDAISLTSRSLEGFTLSYHYLDKVHRIFGDRRPMSSHLLHTDVKIGQLDTLTLYGYLLDYELAADQGLSSTTYGLRWSGARGPESGRLSYAFEAAQQQDAGDNPNELDAEYLLAELSFGKKALTATAGYEMLSGSPEEGAFSTPLATLHKWNGWADKFLRTPTDGLVDLYVALGGGVGKFKWQIIYHDFQPENGDGEDYGTELDALATYKTQRGLTFGLKLAFYDAEAFATDTDKIMVWTAYRFEH